MLRRYVCAHESNIYPFMKSYFLKTVYRKIRLQSICTKPVNGLVYRCGYDLHVIEYQRPLLLPTLRIVWHQVLIFDDQESFLAFKLVSCWFSHLPRKVLVLRFSPLLKNKKFPNSKSTRKGRRRTFNFHPCYLSKSLFIQFNFFFHSRHDESIWAKSVAYYCHQSVSDHCLWC